MVGDRKGGNTAVILAVLAGAVVLVFGRALGYGFVNFDDPHYVINNYPLHAGLTWEGVRWAFTTGYAENWHPLTWLSHMLDFELYGMAPGAHRLTNILLHIGATWLLFAALRAMTRATYASAAVAFLFAIHPQHVESVAWIAERKDVLCGLFWMATLYAYASYARRPNPWRYTLVLLLFALSLLAKSMAVTLPCVLLLLDYWPLRRGRTLRKFTWLFAEKVPLFALAAAQSVITVLVQDAGGTTKSLAALPLWVRLANAPLACVHYLEKTVVPTGLAAFYPHPERSVSVPLAVVSALLLLTLTAAAWRLRRRMPWLLVGWLWFLGTLAPVIGVVQVGDQAYADRYMYLPMVGLLIAGVWACAQLLRDYRHARLGRLLRPALAAWVVVLIAFAYVQVGYWQNSMTLWERALAVTEQNGPAHNNLGRAYHDAGRLEEARTQFEEALRVSPGMIIARNNLALLYLDERWPGDRALRGRLARAEIAQVLQHRPDDPRLYLNLGLTYLLEADAEGAEAAFRQALNCDPQFPAGHFNLGALLFEKGHAAAAAVHFAAVLEQMPGNPDAQAMYERSLAAVDSPKGDAVLEYE